MNKNIRSKFAYRADALAYLQDRGWVFMYESLGEITMRHPTLPGLRRILQGRSMWKVVAL